MLAFLQNIARWTQHSATASDAVVKGTTSGPTEAGMNDPHVEALFYKIEHHKGVEYIGAEPIVIDRGAFRIELQGPAAKIKFEDHFSTVESARSGVKPWLDAWEIHAAIESQPDEIRFVFDRANVIDRQPGSDTVIIVQPGVFRIVGQPMSVLVSRRSYPNLPQHFSVSPDVESMYARYKMHKDGREPLGSMAYFASLSFRRMQVHEHKPRSNLQ